MRSALPVVALAVALGATGCSTGSAPGAGGEPAFSRQPAITVDRSTWQATLQTLFQFQDRQLLREHERALASRRVPVLAGDVLPSQSLFGGKAKAYAAAISRPDPDAPVLQTYERVVQQRIQLAGQNLRRILATVRVTNTTPVPPGADIVVQGSILGRGARARTQLYRYTLEQVGDQPWEIVDAQSYVKQPGEEDGVTDFETVPEIAPGSVVLRVRPLF